MLKRSILLFVAFALVFSCLVMPADAASMFNRQKKSIYFVMDDSGSMSAENGEYDANYSLQSLIAMCDKEDKVSLYFLNSNYGSSRNIDMLSKDNVTIQNIKNTYPSANGGTPYDAVSVAQRELTDSVMAGDETEYWLVVLTDGGFDSGSPDPAADLIAFSQKSLANGNYPNVLFISIGGYVTIPSQGTLHYISGTDIVKSMDEAARIISGRIEVTPTYNNGNTEITFDVPYPARNIVVFAQNNEIEITSYQSNSNLDISENYQIEYPAWNANISKSTVCFVKEASNSSISQGPVTFTFDKALVSDNVVVLVEPAIGLVAHFYNQDGQEIDPADLRVGETAKLSYSLCDSETHQPLDESAFGGNVIYRSNINGTEKNEKEFEFQVNDENLNIDMYAELPDGYVLDIHRSDKLTRKRDVIFTLSNGGSFNAPYDKLNEAEGIYANVMVNGNQAGPQTMDDFELKIKGQNALTSRISVEKDSANGRFILHPKAGWFSIFTPKQKSYEVELIDKKGETHTAVLNVEIPGDRNWGSFLIEILLMLLSLYVFFVLVTKKYFRWDAVFYAYNNKIPKIGHKVRESDKATIWQLYWYELKTKDFWLHLLDFFFVPGCQKVTMHEIAKGNFSAITLHAARGGDVIVIDTSAKYDIKTGKYSSNYGLRHANFTTPIRLNNYSFEKGKPKMPLSINEVITKKTKSSGFDRTWYVQYRVKRNS